MNQVYKEIKHIENGREFGVKTATFYFQFLLLDMRREGIDDARELFYVADEEKLQRIYTKLVKRRNRNHNKKQK